MFTPQNKMMLVSEVMIGFDQLPTLKETAILKEALEKMGRSRLGISCIINNDNKLLGILTDGDLRRTLLKVQKPFSAFFVEDALDHAISSPVTIKPYDTLIHAVEKMGQMQIWDLPVVDDNGTLLGLLHLHPAVKALLDIQNRTNS